MRKFLCLFLLFATCHADVVLVSVAPYKFFVEKIAGDSVDTKLMVPSGASPHSFEPTTKQVLDSSGADIWFIIGEGFEKRALPAMLGTNNALKVVDLRDGIETLTSACKHSDCRDPHIWLSPRLAKKQAEIIAKELTSTYPKNAELYQKNLKDLQNELDQLDQNIQELTKNLPSRTLIISHPAYAYFAKDYDLEQLPIEFEGREPSPKQLTTLLQKARDSGSKKVFAQKQHLSKGAKLIAQQIQAEVIEIDPLSEDYINNLLQFAKSLQ